MWNPKETRKLIAQLAGILFGIGGIVLLIQGIQATGKINISLSMLTGEIESGSAGILLLFFSFFMIIIPTFFGGSPIENANEELIKEGKLFSEKQIKILVLYIKILILGLLVTFLSLFFGQILYTSRNTQIGLFLLIVGYIAGGLSIIFAIGIVAEIIEKVEPKTVETKETET